MNPNSLQHSRSRARPVGTRPPMARQAGGFTLLEVLVSLIILSIGLLGLALLQADSLKSSFSADQRTVASNLAYQMVDMMRANRRAAAAYTYVTGDTSQNESNCVPMTYPTSSLGLLADDALGWECQVVRALPISGVPGAGYVVAYAGGIATVTLTWNDRGPTGAATLTQFQVTSEL